MVAIWSFGKPNHPNLAFLKQFARKEIIWPLMAFFECSRK
jgi:hypothetical protein